MLILLTVLSALLLLVVLIQPSKQESLGNAFNGDFVHTTKVEKILTRITFTLFVIIIAILLYLKFQ